MEIKNYTAPASIVKAINSFLEYQPTLNNEAEISAAHASENTASDVMTALNVRAEITENPCAWNYYGDGTGKYDVLISAMCYDKENDRFVMTKSWLSDVWEAMGCGYPSHAWRRLHTYVLEHHKIYKPIES